MSTATIDVDGLVAGVTGGGWVAAGLRTGESGAAVDGETRPVQRLAAAGLGNLVPLVEPVQQAVDRMVVDGSVSACAGAWQRAAETVEQAGQQLVAAARSGEADWTGDTGDRYRKRVTAISSALTGAAKVFTANSTAARMMGEVVGSARTQANDLLNRLVDEVISYVQLASAAAGGITAEVLNEAAKLVDSYAKPVAGIEEQLRQSARQLAGAAGVGSAGEILAAVREALKLAPVLPAPDPKLAGFVKSDVDSGDPNLILAGYGGQPGGGGTTAAAASFQTAGMTPGGDQVPQTRGPVAAEPGMTLAQVGGPAGQPGTNVPADKARELAEKLGIKDWDPSKGFEHNKETVKKVYDYYAGLYADKPQLQWAGMAKLAGVVVYAGFEDMNSISAQGYMKYWAGLSSEQLTGFETKFLEMHKAVFDDLAYPHEVYRQEGIAGIERLDRNGELPPGMVDQWKKIDSGDPAQIADGNKQLLLREQSKVLQPYYDTISEMPKGKVFTEETSSVTQSPIPGGQKFEDHGGNVANLKDRWDWIEKDMLPKYQELVTQNPQEASRLIGEPLDQAAKRFHKAPF